MKLLRDYRYARAVTVTVEPDGRVDWEEHFELR